MSARKLPDYKTLSKLRKTMTLAQIGDLYGVSPAAVGDQFRKTSALRFKKLKIKKLEAKVQGLETQIEQLETELKSQVCRNEALKAEMVADAKRRAWAIWEGKRGKA